MQSPKLSRAVSAGSWMRQCLFTLQQEPVHMVGCLFTHTHAYRSINICECAYSFRAFRASFLSPLAEEAHAE